MTVSLSFFISVLLFVLYEVLQIEIKQKEYYVFDSENSIEICLKVDNGGSSKCPTDAVIYYNVQLIRVILFIANCLSAPVARVCLVVDSELECPVA